VTVDYEKNSFADTGLFVKFVPEEQKLAAMVSSPLKSSMDVMDSLFNSSAVVVNDSNSSVTAPMASNTVPFTTDYHLKWMENVNKKLASIRIRVDRYGTDT
jgi:hypothetical protein